MKKEQKILLIVAIVVFLIYVAYSIFELLIINNLAEKIIGFLA